MPSDQDFWLCTQKLTKQLLKDVGRVELVVAQHSFTIRTLLIGHPSWLLRMPQQFSVATVLHCSKNEVKDWPIVVR